VDSLTEPETARIIAEMAERLLAGSRRLVTAESCTGGWVAKACTDLPGSSNWFLGGVVTYSDVLKVALLGVRPATLAAHGAVSEPVVREMAAGALEHLGGEVAVAVSGIAGPDGGTPDKPVGTVWLAWARRAAGGLDIRTACERFTGDRDAVRRAAVRRAVTGVLES
jgi:nicotinamide-nucleotide amidase